MSSYEMDGYPVESYSDNGEFEPVRQVHCAWASRYIEAGNLDGLEYPYRSGCGAFPSRIKIEPMSAQRGSGSTTATYEEALITVWYSSRINTNAAIIEELTERSEIAPCSPGALYWSDQTAINDKVIPYIHISAGCFRHIRRKVAIVPTGILNQVNSVNTTALTAPVLGITFLAETLLFSMPKIRRTWTVSGITNYYVEQEAKFKSNGGLGWNSAYRAENGAHEYVYDESGNRVRNYPTASIVLV